jgi:transcriptional regulator with XRE-family HTH domain
MGYSAGPASPGRINSLVGKVGQPYDFCVRTTFGTNLLRLREARGLTQGELADLVQSHAPTVSTWEKSDTADPRLSTIKKLAKALKCSVGELTGEPLSSSDIAAASNSSARRQSSTGEQEVAFMPSPATPDHMLLFWRLVKELTQEEAEAFYQPLEACIAQFHKQRGGGGRERKTPGT